MYLHCICFFSSRIKKHDSFLIIYTGSAENHHLNVLFKYKERRKQLHVSSTAAVVKLSGPD